MKDLKTIISRSFARKVNLGNYESADFFSSRNIELPADTSDADMRKWSDGLYEEAKQDVELAILKFRSDTIKKAGGFDASMKQTPAPWRAFKKPERYQKKTHMPLETKEPDWDQVPPDHELIQE